MTITKSDILFYFDQKNKSVAPTVCGVPIFTRPSNAYGQQGDGRYIRYFADTPRFEPDGLLIELGGNNRVDDAFNFAATGSAWAVLATWNISEVNSQFSDQVAHLHTSNPQVNDPAPGRSQFSPFDFSTSFPTNFEAIIERVDAPSLRIGITRGSPSSALMILLDYNWDTDTATAPIIDANSTITYSVETITEVGPNGGRVVRVECSILSDAVGSINFAIYPAGQGTHTYSAIIHYAGHYFYGTPVDGIRSADNLSWTGPPPPQPLAVYVACVWPTKEKRYGRILSIDPFAANSARMFIAWDDDYDAIAYFENGTDAATTITQAITATQNDLVEFLMLINADGSTKLIVRVNGGSVQSVTGAALAAGLPAQWDGSQIELNEIQNNSVGRTKYQQIKMLKLPALASSTDEKLMDEVAGLELSPDGQRVSGVIL